MLCACLTAAGLFPNFVAAFRHIQEVRPRVCLPTPCSTSPQPRSKGQVLRFETPHVQVYINERQKQSLLEWSQQRGDVLPEDTNTMPREKPPELE